MAWASSADGGLPVRNPHYISNDDIEEHASTGMVDVGSSDLELSNDPNRGSQFVGLRFHTIDITKDGIVTNVYIEFETNEVKLEATSLRFTMEEADNARLYRARISICPERQL